MNPHVRLKNCWTSADTTLTPRPIRSVGSILHKSYDFSHYLHVDKWPPAWQVLAFTAMAVVAFVAAIVISEYSFEVLAQSYRAKHNDSWRVDKTKTLGPHVVNPLTAHLPKAQTHIVSPFRPILPP
jgi:hypothetical protein